MKKNDSVLKKKNKKLTITTDSLFKFFVVFFFCSLFVCAVMAVATGGDSWKMSLFHSGSYTDLYMDFFNSLRDASADDVYTARNNIYPPLCLLVFKICGLVISDELLALPNTKRTLLQTDEACMMIYILFAIVCILAMTSIIKAYTNRLCWENGKTKTVKYELLSFILIISYPVMYCIERGNIIILSMIFTMFFVFFKDSENKYIRELSYISLALAAGIKLYPAIFGIMLLLDKKYKDALRLVVYGIIAVIVPFVFFIDFDKLTLTASSGFMTASISDVSTLAISSGSDTSPILNILENLLSFATNKKSRLNFSSVSIENFIFIFSPQSKTLAKITCVATEGIAVVALLFAKKKWQQTFLLSYLMLNIPSASSSYALTFLIIPFVMFLFDDKGNGYNSDNRPRIDVVYTVCYALILTPLPMLWYFHEDKAIEIFNSLGVPYESKINQVIATFVFQYLFMQVVVEIISNLIYQHKKSRKKEKAAN